MKQDFMLAKEELSKIGIKRIAADFYSKPDKKGSLYFVKSPATHDRTASLALYPNNRFCDFANGGLSGDCISFVAYVRGCNQWQALKELQAFYGLTDAKVQDRQEAQREIKLQQEKARQIRMRKQAFHTSLIGCIDDLKYWANIYRTAIEKGLYEPFSDTWAYCVNELQKVDYWLDILCAADSKSYPRLKAFHESLPSDRYQWILDCLDILQEQGAFEATQSELTEIKAQRDFELTRQPGAERRCSIEW